jgi:hypothetical protein
MKRYLALGFLLLSAVCWALPVGIASAGPYTELGVASNDSRIVAWATGWTNEVRGPKDIAEPGEGNASQGSPNNVLGPVTCEVGDTISLGDGGQLTLTFDVTIFDGAGDDLVVFENGFYSGLGLFGDLGFVEVSTDGITFARFPGISLIAGPIDPYGTIEPTEVFYLTGKHPGANQQPCEGTGFDLSSLSSHPNVLSGAVNLLQIHYVKVIDVIGNGSTQDSLGNPIYDPYPTGFENGGCDLQAVGVINGGQISCTDEDEDSFSVEGGGCGPVDCDDADPDVYPGASEGPPGDATCLDGKDNNCNGLPDGSEPACTYNPGSCSGAAVAEAAGRGTEGGRKPERANPFLLFLLPLYAIGVWRVRRIFTGNSQ